MSWNSGYTFRKLKVDKGSMGLQLLTEKNVNKKDSEEVYELMIPAGFTKFKVDAWLTQQAKWVAKNGKCENPDEMKNETLVQMDENEAISSISSDESSEEDLVVHKKSKQT